MRHAYAIATLCLSCHLARPSFARAPVLPPPTCVAAGTITSAAADGASLSFCVSDGDEACWRVDLDGGAFTPVPAGDPSGPSGSVPPPTATVSTDSAGGVTVCPVHASCRAVPEVRVDPDARLAAGDDGDVLVVQRGERFDIFDGVTGRASGHFAGLKGRNDPAGRLVIEDHAVVLGTAVGLVHNTDAGPAERMTLYDVRGRRLGAVAGGHILDEGDEIAPVHVADTVWAFHDESRSATVLVDVRSARTVATLPRGLRLPGRQELLLLTDDGDVARVAPSGKIHATLRAPRCPSR